MEIKDYELNYDPFNTYKEWVHALDLKQPDNWFTITEKGHVIAMTKDTKEEIGRWQDKGKRGYIMENKKIKLTEKAKSKAQQHLFGMVRALQKGDIAVNDIPKGMRPQVAAIASKMSKGDVKDFAATKIKKMPQNTPAEDSADKK